MNRVEFGKAIAYLTGGIGKALTADQLEVYFDCLSDLPFDSLMIAAKRVLMNHRWASFPSIAELREAASETMRGRVSELAPAEAWEMAWKAVARIDPEVVGSFDRATAGLPKVVVDSMKAFGVFPLCCGSDPVGVVRGQFLKIYEQLAARDKRAALLPAAVKKAIEGIGRTPPAIPANMAPALAGIGRPVE